MRCRRTLVMAGGRLPSRILNFVMFPILELDLDEGSVATTGGSERDIVTANDVRLGHVIDPRAGKR
ncbi:MAG: hypothetical protein CM1200mP25_0440 [Acidobacteriota bacterium]|nr:MAG: hypothetical protein CM1200mP25_0440 [Acidobacteriota bacterium]